MVPDAIVGEREMARFADRDASQASDPHGEVFVRIGPVDDPPSAAACSTGGKAEAAVEAGIVVVLQADEMELAFFGKVGAGAFAARTEAKSAESLAERGARQKEERCDEQS